MNLKIKLFVIIFLSIINVSYGQNISIQNNADTLVADFVKNLQINNIDTICIYKDYCIGCEYINKNDSCYSRSYMSIYILWIKEGKTYLNKKDNCFDYSIVEINSTSLWKIYFSYKDKIKKEKVKPFQYVEYMKHKKNIYTIFIDHSNHRDFEMITNDDVFIMKFDDFNLKKEEDGKYKNINYLHNQNLKGKRIIDELSKLMKDIEGQKLFVKQRRI